jgi:ribonuclease R
MNKLSERVSDYLKTEFFRTFKTKEIARSLSIPAEDYQKLRNSIRSLVRKGDILRFKKNRYGISRVAAEVVGRLHVSAQGYGFVIVEKGNDVFISQKNIGKAFHKDVVRARLFAASSGDKQEGQVVEVLERARNSIVGTFRVGQRNCYVIPDDLKIHKDIIIGRNDIADALDGQKVVATIDDWEFKYANPYGRIVEVLGNPHDPGVDILSIIHGHSLPMSFPQNVIQEAENFPISIPTTEIENRLDLRDKIIFTIDPKDAKDFDDAISLEILENGNYQLGVHIADVSYYVKDKSPLNNEAFERGTSVYLVDRVVPMLPEKLSNEICSLSEGHDKLCYSVLMRLSPQGDLLSYQIKETVINSKKRFTYQEAQTLISGKKEDKFSTVLRQMISLYKILLKKRQKRGSIDFDTLELEVELDKSGLPVALKRKQRQDTNRMIEEFMLLANETVAKHIGKNLLPKENVPFVYRVHEKPDVLSVEGLVAVANAFGINISMPKKITPFFFQKLANQVKNHNYAPILQSSMLRAMTKAKYKTDNAGHFGLAYNYYTHFTSPIRRFPDLMVHRVLKRYEKGERNFITQDSLEKICAQSTENEIKAQEAERATIKLKQVEFMERHLGETFDGYISRIVQFGLFVQLPEFLIDGLIHVSSLDDDYYIYDEKTYTLVGSHRNKKYRLGDKVKVQVAKVDRNERIIDFVLS